ncbi:MAG: nicotinate-nucleotide adenylyltransferase [Proteobacteria bacterium]|nr:MAG: nicotinate-nucleotide adenylyltransferase [Pseudomonadota bacterium]
MEEENPSADRKALRINLDKQAYGTFAEIGAGQEVARHFFRVGGASGTIAKTMSAYDMKFSDEIYGKCKRYVSRERLLSMLDHEYKLLIERLNDQRGTETRFFVFADTVAARNFKGTNECHGWMGIRVQSAPGSEPNDIIMHVRMTDKENFLQQQALGIVGTNLIYGAFYHPHDPDALIRGLLDELSIDRLEVDMIEFRGPNLKHLDNRLMSLKLLQYELTNAIMFGPDGTVLQPSEVLYKKPVLVERGSFRPITNVNTDMLSAAQAQFFQEKDLQAQDAVVLMEMTLNNLTASGGLDHQDFLARVDTLSALNYNVLISDYPEYYRLVAYLRRYTKEMIGMVMGINNLLQVLNEKFYENLEGGILESFGRLFGQKVKLYIYPMSMQAYQHYLAQQSGTEAPRGAHYHTSVVTARNVQIPPHLRSIYQYLLDMRYIECIQEYSEKYLNVLSREVIKMIQSGDPKWEEMVPGNAVKVIKERKMFGLKA